MKYTRGQYVDHVRFIAKELEELLIEQFDTVAELIPQDSPVSIPGLLGSLSFLHTPITDEVVRYYIQRMIDQHGVIVVEDAQL